MPVPPFCGCCFGPLPLISDPDPNPNPNPSPNPNPFPIPNPNPTPDASQAEEAYPVNTGEATVGGISKQGQQVVWLGLRLA